MERRGGADGADGADGAMERMEQRREIISYQLSVINYQYNHKN